MKFLSRKFILTAASLVLISGLLYFGKLSPDQFTPLLGTILGIYGAANVADGFSGKEE